ncbi:MAG TPA: hypothetical protein VG892_07555 [Terriglobales bacterium]|nr:hypothetical protein [Terriglobales bacterium]
MSLTDSPDLAMPRRVAFQGPETVAMASHGDDRALHVEFFVEDEYQTYESNKQGRAVYKSVNKVRIHQPGNKSDIILKVQMEDQPNMPSHPHRFPRQWQAFLAQQEQVPDGTPLEMCKFVPSHRVKELKAMHIHTAEQLAKLSDGQIQSIGMDGRRLRDLASAYLSEDTKVAELSSALAENSVLKNDLAAMKEQLQMLNARMGQQLHSEGKIYSTSVPETPQIKRRGRPRKDENNGDHS